MAETKTTILFICEAESSNSPPSPVIEDLIRELIEPALPSDLDYDLVHGAFRQEPGMLDHFVELMAQVDLVIMDLTELSSTGHFLYGARKYLGLPTIFICDWDFNDLPSFVSDENIISYSPDNPEQSLPALSVRIKKLLSGDEIETSSESSPRIELAERIETTAEVIRDLRINSAGESVEELLSIATELRNETDDSPPILKRAADKAIAVINALLDELSSQRGARMAITAAVSLIVGGTGVSGAAAFSAGLAFWYGPDVFRSWMGRRKS